MHYGYGTGGGDVRVGEGGNLRPKTLLCGGGDLEDDILKEERRGKSEAGRREGQGRKAVSNEGEGRREEGRGEGGRKERERGERLDEPDKLTRTLEEERERVSGDKRRQRDRKAKPFGKKGGRKKDGRREL